MTTALSYLIVAFLVLLVAWANERNRCPECGGQLLWRDPKRSDVPLTRCFTCEGDHPAYVRNEYHHRYDFDMRGGA